MFANVSANDTGCTSQGNSPFQLSHLNQSKNFQQYSHYQQTPSSSFIGQKSNDSGIHTEDYNTNNNSVTVHFKPGSKPSSLQNSSRHSNNNNSTLHNAPEDLRSSTAPNTPAGTVTIRGKNGVVLDAVYAGLF